MIDSKDDNKNYICKINLNEIHKGRLFSNINLDEDKSTIGMETSEEYIHSKVQQPLKLDPIRSRLVNLEKFDAENYKISKTTKKFKKKEFYEMCRQKKSPMPIEDELHELEKMLYNFKLIKPGKSKGLLADNIIIFIINYFTSPKRGKDNRIAGDVSIEEMIRFASLRLHNLYIPTIIDAYEISKHFPKNLMKFSDYVSVEEYKHRINNFSKLSSGRRISLIRQGGVQQKYWNKMLTDSHVDEPPKLP